MLSIKKQENRSEATKRPLLAAPAFLLMFIVLMISSIRCANIQQPTGGPIDSIAPILLNEEPKNLSTNFEERKITLSYDEFIRLNNHLREISISPEMETLPEFKVKRRDLEITLPDSLAENTTYVINFGKAIADNNEGNPVLDYSYVFSTGDKIDSLSITGKVINAKTNEPEMDVSVLLIPVSQDSIFGKRKANVFARTDSSGNFKLNYLRENQYRIYALKEQNNDRIYNSPDESIGFLMDSIDLKGDTSGIQIWLSREVPKTFRVLDRKIERNGQITISLNRPLEEGTIYVTDPDSLDLSKVLYFNQLKDSAFLWVRDLSFDSIKMQIHERDTLLDSILIRRPIADKYTRNLIITNNLNQNEVSQIKQLQLYSSAPIQSIDRSKIKLREDSTNITNYQIIKDTLDARNLLLRYNWKPKKDYELTLEKEAFKGYFTEINEQTTTNFTLDESARFGHLSFEIQIPDSTNQYIIELINEDNTVVFQTDFIGSDTTLIYRNYLEGKYRLKITYDTNNNDKWDPGTLDLKMAPERVWYFDKIFNIRANWEQEEKITIPPKSSPRQILPPSNNTNPRGAGIR